MDVFIWVILESELIDFLPIFSIPTTRFKTFILSRFFVLSFLRRKSSANRGSLFLQKFQNIVCETSQKQKIKIHFVLCLISITVFSILRSGKTFPPELFHKYNFLFIRTAPPISTSFNAYLPFIIYIIQEPCILFNTVKRFDKTGHSDLFGFFVCSVRAAYCNRIILNQFL